MSLTEIMEELPRLDDSARRTILRRLVELDSGVGIDESPEMLAAIDEGIRSIEAGAGVPIDDARQRLAGWIIK